MIVIDTEFSSLNFSSCALLSIGMVDLNDSSRTFYREYRAFDGADIRAEALKVSGFTKKQITDKKKPLFKEAMNDFIDWVNASSCTIFAGQNVMYDLMVLWFEFKRAGVKWPWGHRSVDLHSYMFCHQWKKEKKQPIRHEDGRSSLDLTTLCRMAGIEFTRGESHNALEDAKLTAECFSRLMFGKKIFDEF